MSARAEVEIKGLERAIAKIERMDKGSNDLGESLLADTHDTLIDNLEFNMEDWDKNNSFRDSIESTRDVNTIEVEVTHPKAALLEYGSPPHVIRNISRKALAFIAASGELLVRKKVMHPGFPGKKYFTKAVNTTKELLKSKIKSTIKIFMERGSVPYREVILRQGKPVVVHRAPGGRFVAQKKKRRKIY